MCVCVNIYIYNNTNSNRHATEIWINHLTEGGQSKHAVELPFLGVPDDVSRVTARLGAVEQGPPEVSLTQQAEHTQLPVDLEGGRTCTNTHTHT